MGWTSKKEPLSEKALKEMRFIMDGIKEGRLQHDQGSWHCGSAHCFAGWCEVIAATANESKKGFFSAPLSKLARVGRGTYMKWIDRLVRKFNPSMYVSMIDGTDGKYAKERWGLNPTEANLLFKGDNTKADLERIVSKFEAGKRYENRDPYYRW